MSGIGATAFYRRGWFNALRATGYECRFFDPSKTPAFDAFNEFMPDVFIGAASQLDTATIKCLRQNKPKILGRSKNRFRRYSISSYSARN